MKVTHNSIRHLAYRGETPVVRAYAYHLLEIRRRLKMLEEFVDSADFDKLDYGNVGDVAKVHQDLEDVCQFLKLYDLSSAK